MRIMAPLLITFFIVFALTTAFSDTKKSNQIITPQEFFDGDWNTPTGPIRIKVTRTPDSLGVTYTATMTVCERTLYFSKDKQCKAVENFDRFYYDSARGTFIDKYSPQVTLEMKITGSNTLTIYRLNPDLVANVRPPITATRLD